MSKTLVTYFSASGVTAKIAEQLSEAIGADLHEIRPKVSYTQADLNWRDENARSTVEMKNKSIRPEIAEDKISIAEYEQFLLALEEMPEEQRLAINKDVPSDYADHIPDEWEQIYAAAEQTENGKQAPMTHVNYWDALAYARYIGGGAGLPDAAQLQAAQQNGGHSPLLEWSATTTGENPHGLYPEDTPLLIDMAAEARPCPAGDIGMRLPRIGFRLIFPTS